MNSDEPAINEFLEFMESYFAAKAERKLLWNPVFFLMEDNPLCRKLSIQGSYVNGLDSKDDYDYMKDDYDYLIYGMIVSIPECVNYDDISLTLTRVEHKDKKDPVTMKASTHVDMGEKDWRELLEKWLDRFMAAHRL